MTRFARSHGSKASNERQPEEATSWSIFKQQLTTQQSASEQTASRGSEPETQPALLIQKERNIKTKWSDFKEETGHSHKGTKESSTKKRKLDKPAQKPDGEMLCEDLNTKKKNLFAENGRDLKITNTLFEKVKVRKKDKTHKLPSANLRDVLTADSETKFHNKLPKHCKDKRKLKYLEKSFEIASYQSSHKFANVDKTRSTDSNEGEDVRGQLNRKQGMFKKKNISVCLPDVVDESKSILVNIESLKTGSTDNEGISILHQHKKEKKKKKKTKELCRRGVQDQTTTINQVVADNCSNTSQNPLEKKSKRQKRNFKKLNDPCVQKEHKRRKKLISSSTVFINGQETKVTMFDGFPVRTEDAENLKQLRKEMIDCGLPSVDIDRTIKLERRKAEKALAREKRKVCFHCRKGGHNLSDCPELKDFSNQDATLTGICFKCGSTEHTHFQCRVVRGQEFRFAKCFICQEQGHISQQCPDNPRGLYPKGGACRVCGDVTHLKKDCPELHEKKEQKTLTLITTQGDKLEALDEDLKDYSQLSNNTSKNKIIKF